MNKTTKTGRLADQQRVNIGTELSKDERFGSLEVRPAVKY
jgi:hypothetical protein